MYDVWHGQAFCVVDVVHPDPLLLFALEADEVDVQSCDVEDIEEHTDDHPHQLDWPKEWEAVICEAPAHPDADGHGANQQASQKVEEPKVERVALQSRITC